MPDAWPWLAAALVALTATGAALWAANRPAGTNDRSEAHPGH